MVLINYLLGDPEAVGWFLEAEEGKKGFLEMLFEFSVIDESRLFESKPKLGDRKTLFGTGSEDL